MKTFLSFLNESPLSFPSSFGEVRGNTRPKVLSWDGSHSSIRGNIKKGKKKVNETVKIRKGGDDEEWYGRPEPESHSAMSTNAIAKSSTYNGGFHDHADIKPLGLSGSHISAIHKYSSMPGYDMEHGHSSSHNMNGYLRNRMGDKKVGIAFNHTEDNVKKSISKLSDAFTPENTNKSKVTTYGGVPEHIGKKLMKSGSGARHVIPGFTSTTTSKITAKSYGDNHHTGDRPTHIIKYHLEPGVGMSVVNHSPYSENEVLLNHGASLTYHKTTTHNDSISDHKVHVHHVTVHNEYKPLDSYGKYDHKEEFNDPKE
jgi:hypothetical protein